MLIFFSKNEIHLLRKQLECWVLKCSTIHKNKINDKKQKFKSLNTKNCAFYSNINLFNDNTKKINYLFLINNTSDKIQGAVNVVSGKCIYDLLEIFKLLKKKLTFIRHVTKTVEAIPNPKTKRCERYLVEIPSRLRINVESKLVFLSEYGG